MIKKLIFPYLFLVTVLISCSDNPSASDNNSNSVSFDLDSIRKRGKPIAVTDFNSTNYFIYRGEPMGFHYELLKSFSDHIGIDLEIVTENHLEHALLCAKYFKNSRSSIIVKSDYYALSTGKVSKYDDMIREFSVSIKWDWRLLASLICQESRFDPNVKSWAGAYGLMQIMPVTGRNFGIDITSSPENNMKAGIMYINWLHSIFDPKISDEKERLNFILAAYNAGPGHVLDAMKLAEKNGMEILTFLSKMLY